MAPTPEEFAVSTPAQGLESEMVWEALDSRLVQAQREAQQEEEVPDVDDNGEADSQLAREACAAANGREEQEIEEQLSREASEYPEARTPSSTTTLNRFRSPIGSPNTRSRSAPARTKRHEPDSEVEEEDEYVYLQEVTKGR